MARSTDSLDKEFESLYRENIGYILNKISIWVKDRTLADELTQETFIKAYNGFDNFKNHSKHRTWLYRIARNTAYDHFRKERREDKYRIVHEDFIGNYNFDPETLTSNLMTQRIIEREMEAMHPEKREALEMRIDGLDVKEIAKKSSSYKGTICWRLYSARKLIKKRLAEY